MEEIKNVCDLLNLIRKKACLSIGIKENPRPVVEFNRLVF